MLASNIQLHPFQAAIPDAMVNVRVGSVSTAENMVSTWVSWVDQLPAFTHGTIEEGSEHSHAQDRSEYSILGRSDAGDVSYL